MSNTLPPRATQAAVARLAGVERSTVSHVLSGKATRISPGVAERVRHAAAQLHYTPNRHARALLTGRSRTIGILLASPWHSQSWVWSRIALGFQQALFESDYDALLQGVQAEQLYDQARNLLQQNRVDGVLLLGPQRVTVPFQNGTETGVLPLVAVDLGTGHQCPAIYQNATPGVLQAAEHLYALGHRRFAWLGPDLESDAPSSGRERTLSDFLAEKQLTFERVILPLSLEQAGHPTAANLAEIRQAITKRLPVLRSSTAVVCWNDPLAASLCHLLQEHGLSVPGDVSVTGFDDLQPSLFHPSLSTVSGAYPEMGAAAAELLLALINQEKPDHPMAVPTWFIARESTGPVNNLLP